MAWLRQAGGPPADKKCPKCGEFKCIRRGEDWVCNACGAGSDPPVAKLGAAGLYERLLALRPRFAAAAQEIYDAWSQDAEGFDEEFGTGGICDAVSEAMGNIVASEMGDVEFVPDVNEGGDHAWLVLYDAAEACEVDIPPSVYERGGGYTWAKIPGVVIGPEHVHVGRLRREDVAREES